MTISNMRSMLSPQQVFMEQMKRAAQVFQGVDRTMGRAKFKVGVVYGGPAPAWSDGINISLNAEHIAATSGKMTGKDALIALSGLNIHEMSHGLYTPRVGSWLRNQVIQNGLGQSFNLLEDQRIETLMVTEYPSTAHFLSMAVTQFILNNPDARPTAYAFLTGRKYVPQQVRDAMRAIYVNQQDVDELDRIVAEYKRIPLDNAKYETQGARRAYDLIVRFNTLLNNTRVPDPNGHDSGNRPDEDKGTPVPVDQQQEIMDDADDQETQDGDGDDQGDSDGDGEGEPGKGKGKSDSGDEESDEDGEGSGSGSEDSDDGDNADDDADADGSGDTDDADDDGDAGDDGDQSGDDSDGAGGESAGDGESDGTDSGGPGGAAGGNLPDALTDEELEALLEAIYNAESNDEEVVADIERTQRVIVQHLGKRELSVQNKSRMRTAPVEQELTKAAELFSRELQRVVVDADPGFRPYQAAGRINVQRVMRGADFDEAFDQWDEGQQDAADFEVSILLDQSSSMSGHAYRTSEAAWVIKRGMEKIGSTVTVLGFGDRASVIYEPTDKARPDKMHVFGTEGGTEPHDSLEETLRLMATSRRKHKVMFILSDGNWNYGHTQENHDMIDRLNQGGVMTVAVLITSEWARTPDPTDEDVRHRCQMFKHLTSPHDLIPVARQIVKSLMGV